VFRSAKLWLLPVALLVSLRVDANEQATGWCQQGGNTVTTAGISSSNYWQQTFPSVTVSVYNHATLTLSTIYSNNTGTSKANPFTAGSDGSWFFYAANGRYDVTCTNSSPTVSLSFPDILLFDNGGVSGITSINSQTGPSITIQGASGQPITVTTPSSNTVQINLPQANGSTNGFLASSDWTTFNSKQSALTFSSPLANSSGTVSLGTVGILLGGTGQTTASAAFAALSPLTTVGDLIVFNGTVPVRLAGGTNGYFLTRNTSSGVGISWTACSICSVTTPISVANGGTGLSSGTSGGVPCYTGATTVASSSLLVSGNPLIGGGSGVCPGTTGPFSAYNSLTLTGQGMPPILYSPALSSSQSATVGPTTMFTPASAGIFELCYYAVVTQAATSSSSLTPTFSWNDGSARSTTGLIAANVPNFQAYTGNSSGAVLNGCVTIASAASQAITFTFTYASSGATAMNYIYVVSTKEIR